MKKPPRPGERVRVMFVFHPAEGEVMYVSDLGRGPVVTVAVEIEGSDEPIVGAFPLDEVEYVSAA